MQTAVFRRVVPTCPAGVVRHPRSAVPTVAGYMKQRTGRFAAAESKVMPAMPAKLPPAPAAAAATSVAEAPTASISLPQLERVLREFEKTSNLKERYALLLHKAKALPHLPEADKTAVNRVMGCTSQVWVTARLNEQTGCVQFAADSDSELTRGLGAVLVEAMSGLTPEEVMQVQPESLASVQLGPAVMSPSRTNGFLNMLETMKKRALMLTEQLPRFPSLLISADQIQPQGAFAEAQAQYLEPDAQQVDALVKVLSEKRIGVVAHFYMDPQVQGVLTSAAGCWPHIAISDSLVMADKAVRMAEQGCTAITVLGVDFMSENVRAILNEAGHKDVQVYRMDPAHIGCSLAEAAESPMYHQYLSEAAHVDAPALHVVYINTSLRTKAQAHAVVPTITCTSSNVVQTVLQAFAQVPDLTVWYGPDTYMGRNLAQLFTSLASQPDEEIQKLHKGHTQASIKALLPRLRYFEDGICVVHHIFGGRVTELVQKGYNDALLTAHFEVPGEMFTLAIEAKKRGMGVVGSTQNILDFIAAKLQEALERPFPEKLQVVLGTESGMITSIVRKVQSMLHASGRSDVQVEVVFPVSPEAITTKDQVTANGNGQPAMLPGGLSMIPGPASGEGCSTEGGCASCPYMKMNSLRALMSVCNKVNTPAATLLESYKPMEYTESVNGRSMAEAGCEPILHMRAFQKTGQLPDALVSHIQQQAPAS